MKVLVHEWKSFLDLQTFHDGETNDAEFEFIFVNFADLSWGTFICYQSAKSSNFPECLCVLVKYII